MKYSLFLALGLVAMASAQNADRLTQLGVYVGDFLIGTCNAFSENPDSPDTSTVCYKACLDSQTQITKTFTMSNYNNQAFNMGDFNNFMQVFFIKLMTQMDKCSYNNFLLTVDNRLSDLSFLGGMLTKLAVETAQKFIMGQETPTYKSIMAIFNNFSSSATSIRCTRTRSK